MQLYRRGVYYDDAGRPVKAVYWTAMDQFGDNDKRDPSLDEAFMFDGEGRLTEQALVAATYGVGPAKFIHLPSDGPNADTPSMTRKRHGRSARR
jgi:hypothetical protein